MKTLTIVIPIYNEGGRIEKTLKALKRSFCFKTLKLTKVVFVDDGSTDETKKALKKARSSLKKVLKVPIQIFSYPENRGRGYAVKLGCLNSISDYTLYLDGDLSIPLSNLKKFVPFAKQNYDLIAGSKKKPGAVAKIRRSLLRTVVGWGHSLVASLILGVPFWDFQGGFKMFSKRLISAVFPLLRINRWGFDMEIIFLAKKMNYKTAEIPVVWSHQDKESKVRLVRDSLRSLCEMLEIQKNWIEGKYLTRIPKFSFDLRLSKS